MRTHSHLEKDIFRLLDGDLDQEELSKLEDELLAHPDGLKMYQACARFHSVFTVKMRVRSLAESWEVVPIKKIISIQHRRWARISAIAAVFLFFCLAGFMWMSILDRRPTRHSFAVSPGANYTLIHDRRDESGDSKYLAKGSRIILKEGNMECWFQKGVRGVLKAPCDLTVNDSNKIRLTEGTGWFQVAKGAEGFTVATPQMKIVDLGTEFGVICTKGEEPEVHVFKGKIQVKSLGSTISQNRVLKSDQSISIGIFGHLKIFSESRRQLFSYLSQISYLPQPEQIKNKITEASALAVSIAPDEVVLDNNSGSFVRKQTSPNPDRQTLLGFTVGNGTNRLLTATIAGESLNSVTSATYGGVPMTLAAFAETGDVTNDRAEIWYLLNPPIGTADIVVSAITEPGGGWHLGAASFSNVRQQAPITTTAHDKGDTSDPTITFNSELGDGIIVDIFEGNNNPTTISTGLDQTEIFTSGGNSSAGGYAVGASYRIANFVGKQRQYWHVSEHSEWAQVGAFFAAAP